MRLPGLVDPEAPVLTREDLDEILRFTEAAVLTGDPRIFGEFVAWLTEQLGHRGVPRSVVAESLEVLHDALPDAHVMARRLLAGAGGDIAG